MLAGHCFYLGGTAQTAAAAQAAHVTLQTKVHPPARDTLGLEGKWSFRSDPSDTGIRQRWFDKALPDTIYLPGSMTTNGKGDDVTADTHWTGGFSRSDWYSDTAYARYRRPGHIAVPFCLQPVKYYVGAAWYERTVTIPGDWQGRHVLLFLERCHWEATLWLDGRRVGMQNALGAPDVYDLDFISPGRHRLTLRIDNRIRDIDPGMDAHSISDNTQTNWNGIIGSMRLECRPGVYLSDVQVYPDVAGKKIRVRTVIGNITGKEAVGQLSLHVVSIAGKESIPIVRSEVRISGDSAVVETEYPMGHAPRLWDEFHPNLYTLHVGLNKGKEAVSGGDERAVDFGMRSFKAAGEDFQINGRPVLLRGTLECAIFPRTGFPPTDVASWLRIFRIARAYGLNHMRFHSWCPPEAAFEAADRVGFYLSIECSAWTTVGDGKPIDQFIYDESIRIVRNFGNHPSFCMMPYGNEPGGQHLEAYLTAFVQYWKARDERRLYTTASGWPVVKENDYNVSPEPRIQHWGEGLKSLINCQEPGTDYDWDTLLPTHAVPTVSHEIGQWCVYPDFKEVKKYSGVLKPKNFGIFWDKLREHGMAHLADSFLMASGKLQALCYKADIEAALRTPHFGGFQLLDLHDFPGQGTALVGVLDPFWDDKGYISAREYRRFCNATVPLVRLPRLIYTNNEVLTARVEIAHFGERPLVRVVPEWTIRDKSGKVLFHGKLASASVPIGNAFPLGSIRQSLAAIKEPAQLTLTVRVDTFVNAWHIFVYPDRLPPVEGKLYVTGQLDARAADILQKGGRVLLSARKGSVKPDKGGGVALGFSSIFWNTAWTHHQAPWTLGILCNPAHPALREFPTEYYSDYQWWDALTHANVIRLDAVSPMIQPIVRVIDDWNTAWPLGLIFECRVGPGRLLVSGIDLLTDAEKRPAARQLLYSLEKYASGSRFNPAVPVDISTLQGLFN